MGQRSRLKRERRRNLGKEQSASAASRIAPQPSGDFMADVFGNIDNVDLDAIRAHLSGQKRPDPTSGPETESEGQERPEESGYSNSRWNSYKDGRRAKVLFPPPVQTLIDELTANIVAGLRARTLFDYWLCKDMARSSVQIDLCAERVLADQERVLKQVECSFDADAAARADRLAKKLPLEPYDVARELGRDKYGALLLISRWESLAEAVTTNHRLDEVQVQMAYDLLAVPAALRNGSRQVPAADDEPAILALCAREVAGHNANLQASLNERHELDRKAAKLGIMKEQDKLTRGLKADETRARTRFRWALKVFEMIRKGVDPATIIDPETKAPIQPDVSTTIPDPPPQRQPDPPAAATPPPAEAQAGSPQPPLPEDCQGDDAETFRIAAFLIGEQFGAPSSAQPRADAGPAPPGPDPRG